jgi:hypothetical protein
MVPGQLRARAFHVINGPRLARHDAAGGFVVVQTKKLVRAHGLRHAIHDVFGVAEVHHDNAIVTEYCGMRSCAMACGEEVEAAAQVEVPKQISMRKELRRFLDSQGLTKSQRVRALQILTDVGAPLPVE